MAEVASEAFPGATALERLPVNAHAALKDSRNEVDEFSFEPIFVVTQLLKTASKLCGPRQQGVAPSQVL